VIDNDDLLYRVDTHHLAPSRTFQHRKPLNISTDLMKFRTVPHPTVPENNRQLLTPCAAEKRLGNLTTGDIVGTRGDYRYRPVSFV
jgi:hypothetical protein